MSQVKIEKNQLIEVAKSGLFHTPNDFEEIQKWIEKHPTIDGSQMTLWTVYGMVCNLLADQYYLIPKEDIDG